MGIPNGRIIQSLSEIKVADNRSDLLDRSIDISLSDAGVLPNSSRWASGSYSTGKCADYSTGNFHCDGFTSGESGMANWGSASKTDANWISAAASNCGSNYYRLCIAY